MSRGEGENKIYLMCQRVALTANVDTACARLLDVAIVLYISGPRRGSLHFRSAVVTLTYWIRHIRWRPTTTTMKTFVLALCVFVAVVHVNADLRSDLESAALSWVQNTYGRNNSLVKLDFTTTTVRGFYCVF